MKIKITTNKEKPIWTYSVWHGFGFPISKIPFKTKWILDKENLSAEQLGIYLSHYIADMSVIYFPYGSYQVHWHNISHFTD